MDFLKRVGNLFGISPPKQKSGIVGIADLIDLGRQARYAENYAKALDIFEQSVALAETAQDTTALVIAQLNIADTYIQLERFDEAQILLMELQADTEERQHYTPLAYTLCLIGYFHQIQGDWEQARDTYNQALTIAQKANAGGAIGRAKGHLAETYLREDNATYAEHLLHDALPLLDDSNDVELISHFIGQYGLAMFQLGRDVDGDRLLETALRRAQQLEFKTQVRHWQQVIAERKFSIHDYKAAFEHYHEFLKVSPDPLPETEEYGLVLSNLSEITRQLGQQQESLDYALQAERILSKIDSDTLSSHALTAIGLAMRANTQYDSALDYFQQALASTSSANDTLTIQLEIAQTYVIAKQYTDAEATYQNLIDQLDEATHPELSARANAGLGTTYQKQNILDKAIQQWMIAHKLYESQANHNQTARIICDIAQARYELGDGKRAMSDYERALMLLNSVDKETRGIVMASVAIAYADKGDVPTTEAFFAESIDIARDLKNTFAEALRRNDYAVYLIDIGQTQRAILSLERALKLVSKNQNPLYNAIFRCNTGVAYRALGDLQKSESYHHQASELFATLEESRWSYLNHVHLAEIYLDLEQIEDANHSFPETLRLRDVDYEIQSWLTLARLHLLQSHLIDAETYISQAISTAQSGYRQRMLAKALVLQSQIQTKANNPDAAIETWHSAEKLFNLLQMSKPNPNWLHVSSPPDEE